MLRTIEMIKNYLDYLLKRKKLTQEKPSPEVVSYLLKYSQSFEIAKSTYLKNVRLDKN